MKRNFHSHSSRSGLTGGWLLAVLAVLAVVVIIILFVWRPGAAPTAPGTTPAAPTEQSEMDPLGPEEAAEPPGEPADVPADEGDATEGADVDQQPLAGEADPAGGVTARFRRCDTMRVPCHRDG